MFNNAVYIVCSPRPRVGRTLVARLLIDFFLTRGRKVDAYDLNDETDLTAFFPDRARPAAITDIRDRIALFERLIARDGIDKIVDLGPVMTRPFFEVIRQTLFADEARRNAIAPVVLYVMSDDRTSRNGFAALVRNFPDLTVVPVHNHWTMRTPLSLPGGGRYPAPLQVPELAPGLSHLLDKRPFSFTDPSLSALPMTVDFELRRWMRRIFVGFRELELRILLADLRSALKSPA